MAKDKDYVRMIQSRRWAALRKEVLTAHPLCQQCLEDGFVTPAREVHHVEPVEHGCSPLDKERLMFNRGNLRALCHGCHVEAHKAMGRSGKAASKRRNESQTAAAIRKFFGD